MLEEIKDGCGIQFRVIYQNKCELFNIAIFARQNFIDGKYDRYEYGYLNQNQTLYTKSIYTGGNTGFGTGTIETVNKSFYKNFKLIEAKSITRMQLIAKEDQILANTKQLKYDKEQEAKVIAINKLPKKFNTYDPILQAHFERSTATYNRSKSKLILGAHIGLVTKDKRLIYLNNYTTKDNKLLTAKWSKDCKWLFDNIKINNPKAILFNLLKKENEIKQLIKDAK